MRLQGNLVPSPNSTVPPPARPSYQPSLNMTCTKVPAAALGCSDRSTRRCTVVHFHSRCRNRSESNEATVLEITAGAGIWEYVESGHTAGSPGGSAASSPGGSGGNRCMKARKSGLSHGIRICQWSCCGSQREYCSSCCCQYPACSASPFRQQKFLHSILNSAVPGGVGSNENSTTQWAPADPPCTVCADRVSTRQNCSVQQKAIAHNAVIVLLQGVHNVPAAIRRRPALCWRRSL